LKQQLTDSRASNILIQCKLQVAIPVYAGLTAVEYGFTAEINDGSHRATRMRNKTKVQRAWSIGHGASGMGHWAWLMWHWAWGMGHGPLGMEPFSIGQQRRNQP
jgi:hypothetical protein